MSATVPAPAPAPFPATPRRPAVLRDRGAVRLSFARVLRAEWLKAFTVRSTYWMLGGSTAFVLLFAAGILGAVAVAPIEDVADPREVVVENYGPDPAAGVIGIAVLFAYPLVALLAVLFTAPERSSGLLGATLAAVPRRTPVLLAKLAVSGAVGAAWGAAMLVLSFALAAPVLASLGFAVAPLSASVLQSLAGGALFLALIGVLSAALASLFRTSAAAMGAVLGLLLAAPALLPVIPGVGAPIAAVLPTSAGMLLFQPADQVGWAAIATGGLVLIAWATAAAVLGGVRFTRRDV